MLSLRFQRSVDACRLARWADPFLPDPWHNAYGALGRLRDRYKIEKANLTSEQQFALQKVFVRDTFIDGMMQVRQVSEYVTQGDWTVLRTPQNIPVKVTTSAMALFISPSVTLPDTKGELQRVDHLGWLEKAEKRIKNALDKASVS